MSSHSPIVRWGVLSTARIATRVGAAIRRAEGAELSAVASRSPEKATAWATEHRAARSYGTYEALLDDPEIDVVYIPLPPSLHAQWTIKAAEHGKHVLCEKPLALEASQAEEMAAACREHDVQLMDGVMWLHHPRAAEMHRFLGDGTLGDLRRVTSAFSFHWDEVPTGDFRLSRDLGGGSLGDLGWYCIGATLWAFGDRPLRVFGTARYYGTARDADRNFSGMLWFDRERMASFDCGFDVGMRRWMEVAGTQASLVCDDFTRPWNEERPRFWLHDTRGKMSEHASSPRIQEVCMIDDFCDIVRSGVLDDRWPRQAIETQRVCDALDRSARTGQIVELGLSDE
jgi:predicted dehydrogenase